MKSGVNYPRLLLAPLLALCLLAPAFAEMQVALPSRVPVPQQVPDEARPQAAGGGLPDEAADIPLPEKKPDRTPGQDDTHVDDDRPRKAEPEPPPDPRSAERPDADASLPAGETECRTRLKELGVVFEDRTAESDPAGCSVPYPVSVSKLGEDLDLEPPGLMNCAMAETAARFLRDVAEPAARREMNSGLDGIGQASAYVCRPRNGTRKLSEHAFGNALDIASFRLDDGRTVQVGPAPEKPVAAFFAAIRKAACGPFKTVLGPGSDADHATHLHFDLAPRRNGGTFCQ